MGRLVYLVLQAAADVPLLETNLAWLVSNLPPFEVGENGHVYSMGLSSYGKRHMALRTWARARVWVLRARGGDLSVRHTAAPTRRHGASQGACTLQKEGSGAGVD